MSTSDAPPTVLILAQDTSPVLGCIPNSLANFVVASSATSLPPEAATARAILFVPPASPQLLEEAWPKVPNCEWVHCFFAGVDSITPFAQAHLKPSNTLFSNGRGAFSSSLAEYAMTAALHFTKQVPRITRNTDAGRWDKFTMGVLKGKTLGLIGCGDIAQACAKLAKAFGMRTVGLRRNASKGAAGEIELVVGPYDGPILPAHKRALLEQSDIVVSTLPGTAETKHFMSTEEFAAMKQGSIFISLGRGTVVDERALFDALFNNLGGAALDVFEVEPLAADSPLWSLGSDKIMLTAHNADLTEDYYELGWEVWQANLAKFVKKEPLHTPVNIAAGY